MNIPFFSFPSVVKIFLVVACLQLKADFPKLALQPVSENELLAPVVLTHAGDGSGRLFVVEQRGEIRIIQDDNLLTAPFLDLGAELVTERAGFDERGLLGLAFHPEYGDPGADGEGRLYVYYSAPSPDAPGDASNPVNHQSVVAEYRVSDDDPNVADPSSERVMMTFNQPQFNHNGGQLAFGPDGLLYISTGDGGSSNDNNAGHTGGSDLQPSGVLGNAQDRTKLLGKILRIDPLGSNGPGGEYDIPADNPFVGEGGNIRGEIFAYGLRNPWRFSFDDGPGGTGRLICADVGQGAVEEINLITSGGNYGWRNKEGEFDFDATAPATGPFVDPVAQYAHPSTENGLPQIGLSVTGGYFYRGNAFPELVGHYLFADWSRGFGNPSGTLLALDEYSPGEFLLVIPEVTGGNPIGRFIAALGEDEEGEVYLATKTTLAPSQTDPDSGLPTGAIHRIVTDSDRGDPVSVELTASKDNSMYSENGSNSSGAGPRLFSGYTPSMNERRALLAFDLSALPSGSTVESARLNLEVDNVAIQAQDADMSLYRLTSDWGEEDSDAGVRGGAGVPAATRDATWTQNFFGSSSWATAGGDHVPAASATTMVAGTGDYQWTGPGLVADVQEFIDEPATNFGWVLLSDTVVGRTGKRLQSRESTSGVPLLEVTGFEAAPGHLEKWKTAFFDPGETVDLEEDLDNDGLAGVFEYGAGFDPKSANFRNEAWHFSFASEAETPRLEVVFRRDPRATEVTYVVEVGSDLAGWTTVAESIGGEATTGSGMISDQPLPDDLPFREVRVGDVSGPPGEAKRFMRLRAFVASP